MSYIEGISQASTASSQPTTTTDEKDQTLGQDDFLTLLVAQMQNQDPLNPSDATEFTAQLASFSQLEQLFNLNESMDKLAASQSNSERVSALSMIGKDVLVGGSTFTLNDGPEEIGYKVDGQVEDILIRIQDSNGIQVATMHPSELGPGNHSITWDGLDRNGEALPPGKYKLIVESQTNGQEINNNATPLVRTEVNGIDLEGVGAVLLTDTGEFSLAEVYGVYNSTGRAGKPADGEQSFGEGNQHEQYSAATDGSEIIEEAGNVANAVAEATIPTNS
jgi:flagellar basal-body rod modification protein FlgD